MKFERSVYDPNKSVRYHNYLVGSKKFGRPSLRVQVRRRRSYYEDYKYRLDSITVKFSRGLHKQYLKDNGYKG